MRQGYGHMMVDHYVARLRGQDAARRARLGALTTPDEARAYQHEVRQTIRAAFGPWPERTPLNARIVGTIKRPLYAIEKLLFESRPGCLVTANVYVPRDLQAPAPAVLAPCGHSAEGKAEPLYQAFCQRLAASGFVVLIYDPINQGERDQYVDLDDREAVRSCTAAHNMMGKQFELLGDFFGMWRAWDGIRALDYLLERSEVDRERVGVTGNSGGGTMTTWLWPLDDRLTMAAPGCFVTTFLHNLENELPADCEQYPPGVLGAGLEMADFLIARAPQPVLLLGQHYDYFDRRGHQEACDETRAFYRLLDAPEDRVACFRGPHGHGYHRENQEAMVDFFAHHAGMEVRPLDEPDILEPEALWATPEGEVVRAGAKPIYAMIGEQARERAAARQAPTGEALRGTLERLLHLPERQGAPYHRNLRPVTRNDRTYARYAIETEGGVRAILHKKVADQEHAHTLDVSGAVHLYLPHLAAEIDLAEDELALALQEEHDLYALDVRGLGETMPDEGSGFWRPYGMDYMMHGHALLFGESYLGRRVYDTLACIDLLMGAGAEAVHLYGRGQGAIIALFTALLHDAVAEVTLKNAPQSFAEWTQAPLVVWPSANMLWGVLAHFDLSDCLAALGERATVLEPWDVSMAPVADD